MQHVKEPSKRGGARPGAGRKRTAEKRYMFSAPPDVAALLESLTESKSAYIVRAIRAYIAAGAE